jgi:hypothetical protein
MNAGPAPLIIIQPGLEGTRLDVYGLNAIDAIDELRLTLLHLVAMQADVQIISAVISRQSAVVLPDRNPVPVQTPSANGSSPTSRRLPTVREGKRTYAGSTDDAD